MEVPPPEFELSDGNGEPAADGQDGGDHGGEVVAEHDPGAEPVPEEVEPAVLEDYEESVMVWNGEEDSDDGEEVSSCSPKRRRLI